MAIVATFRRHKHWQGNQGYDEEVTLSSANSLVVENIISGVTVHNHANHGAVHHGNGNPGFGAPCGDYFDNVWRRASLPQGATTSYVEYVVSADANLPGACRLVVSNGAFATQNNIVIAPACYYTDDHYNTYYRLKLTQVVVTKFTDDGPTTTTTNVHGAKHTKFQY